MVGRMTAKQCFKIMEWIIWILIVEVFVLFNYWLICGIMGW